MSDEMLRDIINGLCSIFGNDMEQIILYGSFARQDMTDESDIDIAVIVRTDILTQKRDEFLSWNSEMDMKYDRVFSIVDIETEKMNKWGDVLPFYKNIRKEGVVLWTAA